MPECRDGTRLEEGQAVKWQPPGSHRFRIPHDTAAKHPICVLDGTLCSVITDDNGMEWYLPLEKTN